MKQATLIDITSDDFEAPETIVEFTDLIEDSISAYQQIAFTHKERIAWRRKLNELIDEYNDRRGFKTYNHIH